MSSFHGYFDNSGAVRMSPRVIHFIEKRIGEKAVRVEQCLDADGYRFFFANGTSMIIAAIYIEHLESGFCEQGRMSRNQFEEMVMQEQDVDPRFRSLFGVYPESRDGTTEAFLGQNFDMCMESESGEAPEFGADRFHRSLRKVYWHRYLKKHEQR